MMRRQGPASQSVTEGKIILRPLQTIARAPLLNARSYQTQSAGLLLSCTTSLHHARLQSQDYIATIRSFHRAHYSARSTCHPPSQTRLTYRHRFTQFIKPHLDIVAFLVSPVIVIVYAILSLSYPSHIALHLLHACSRCQVSFALSTSSLSLFLSMLSCPYPVAPTLLCVCSTLALAVEQFSFASSRSLSLVKRNCYRYQSPVPPHTHDELSLFLFKTTSSTIYSTTRAANSAYTPVCRVLLTFTFGIHVFARYVSHPVFSVDLTLIGTSLQSPSI